MKSLAAALLAGAVLFVATGPARADEALAKKEGCTKCHLMSEKKKKGGPPIKEISAKYKGDAAAIDKLTAKVKKGGSGDNDHPDVDAKEADVKKVIQWYMTN